MTTMSLASQSHPEKLDHLMSMGYPAPQCNKALKVAGGDLEQAIGYLLMGERSQEAFDYSASELISDSDLASVLDRGEFESQRESPTLPLPPMERNDADLFGMNEEGSSSLSPEDQLVLMGYTRNQVIQALRVAGNDLEQAANFLLMGDSRQGFLLDFEQFSSERSLRNSSIELSFSGESDSATSAAGTSVPHASNVPHNPPLYRGLKPKIVSTRSFLSVPGAEPFCTCFAASRFLMGGVVSAAFLNEIMEAGIELYRKTNRRFTIDTALKMYGRSHLGINAIMNGEVDPRKGSHICTDLLREKGIRKLMASCRNEQQEGWQVILLELQHDSFCTCLPPKGSSNKFWFFDFTHRSSVRTPGAYALVHNSLLQMEETIETTVASIVRRRDEVEQVPFTLYRIRNDR